MTIIAFCGKKFSGKSTAGNFLIEKYGFEEMTFAGPIKEICRELFNFNNDQLYGSKKEELDEHWNLTPRETFQAVGSSLRNLFSVNLFVMSLKQKLSMKNKDTNIVITDVRFPEEANMIREMGGIVIKIERDLVQSDIDTDISETSVDLVSCDFVVKNENIEDFYSFIETVLGVDV